MKWTKMILLVTSLGMSMFFLQGYGNADDSGMHAVKMQKMEESTMMQDNAGTNKAKAAMEGSMKKPMEKAIEHPKQDEMNKIMTATKDAPMQKETNKPMENQVEMMQ